MGGRKEVGGRGRGGGGEEERETLNSSQQTFRRIRGLEERDGRRKGREGGREEGGGRKKGEGGRRREEGEKGGGVGGRDEEEREGGLEEERHANRGKKKYGTCMCKQTFRFRSAQQNDPFHSVAIHDSFVIHSISIQSLWVFSVGFESVLYLFHVHDLLYTWHFMIVIAYLLKSAHAGQ